MSHQFVINAPSLAVFSDDRDHRYWLVRQWDRTRPLLVTCMFNPSTADANKDDPTIRRLCAFAKAWGYGGILVVNLYSLRSPDPQTIRLRQEMDPGTTRGGTVGDAQAPAWKHALDIAREQGSPVLIAWGALAEGEDVCPFADAARGLSFICLGLTANGSPKHPAARGRSRIPDDQQPIPYRLAA